MRNPLAAFAAIAAAAFLFSRKAGAMTTTDPTSGDPIKRGIPEEALTGKIEGPGDNFARRDRIAHAYSLAHGTAHAMVNQYLLSKAGWDIHLPVAVVATGEGMVQLQAAGKSTVIDPRHLWDALDKYVPNWSQTLIDQQAKLSGR